MHFLWGKKSSIGSSLACWFTSSQPEPPVRLAGAWHSAHTLSHSRDLRETTAEIMAAKQLLVWVLGEFFFQISSPGKQHRKPPNPQPRGQSMGIAPFTPRPLHPDPPLLLWEDAQGLVWGKSQQCRATWRRASPGGSTRASLQLSSSQEIYCL